MTDPSPGAQAFIDQAQRVGAHNYDPLDVVIAEAQGAWVTDVDGRRYLDMLAAYGAVGLGHSHPRIVDALVTQAGRLAMTSRAFHNDQLGPFLTRLCELTGMDRALPMNTGAEAVETAIKAMRKWGYDVKGIPRDRAEIIVCHNNFHGRTTTIVGFSSDAVARDGFGPPTPGFVAIPFDDPDALAAAITPHTCGFLVEPVQGEAGVIIPRPGYLAAARRICEDAGVLLCADEVQTGLGRTGAMFAVDHEDVRPDLLTLGKALGGGVYPVSALCARADVMAVFTPGSHGSTFGGNPLGAAVGRAALDVLVDEDLPARAARLGPLFREALAPLRGLAHVRDVRGRGLMNAIEFTDPRARAVVRALRDAGILAKDTHATTLRLTPPLTIDEADLLQAADTLVQVCGRP